MLVADNVDLGTTRGKYYQVSCIRIMDPSNHFSHEYMIRCLNKI